MMISFILTEYKQMQIEGKGPFAICVIEKNMIFIHFVEKLLI